MCIRQKAPHSVIFEKAVPWVLLLLLAAVVFAAVATTQSETAVPVGAAENTSIYYSSNETASQENEPEDRMNSENVKKYAVRLYNGMIAIFEDNNPVPLYRIDTPISRLPTTDRLLLEKGIYTDTLREAYRLIEDYE